MQSCGLSAASTSSKRMEREAADAPRQILNPVTTHKSKFDHRLLHLTFPLLSLDLPLVYLDNRLTANLLPSQETFGTSHTFHTFAKATKLANKLWCWQCSKSAKTIPKQNPELTRPHHHQTLCLLCQIRKTVYMLRQTHKIQPP